MGLPNKDVVFELMQRCSEGDILACAGIPQDAIIAILNETITHLTSLWIESLGVGAGPCLQRGWYHDEYYHNVIEPSSALIVRVAEAALQCDSDCAYQSILAQLSQEEQDVATAGVSIPRPSECIDGDDVVVWMADVKRHYKNRLDTLQTGLLRLLALVATQEKRLLSRGMMWERDSSRNALSGLNRAPTPYHESIGDSIGDGTDGDDPPDPLPMLDCQEIEDNLRESVELCRDTEADLPETATELKERGKELTAQGAQLLSFCEKPSESWCTTEFEESCYAYHDRVLDYVEACKGGKVSPPKKPPVPKPPVGSGDHATARAMIVKAVQKLGRTPTLHIVQALHSVALLESRGGLAPQGANNWGGIQYGKPPCPQGFIEIPEKDENGNPRRACLKTWPTREAGCDAFVQFMFEFRGGKGNLIKNLESGTASELAKVMRAHGYYGAPLSKYTKGLIACSQTLASALKEENTLAESGGTGSKGGALLVLGALVGVGALLLGRKR